MKEGHRGRKMMNKLLIAAAIIVFFSISSANALINCSVSSSCAGTNILLVSNSTGGWHDAHAQNVSVGTYPFGICCTADDTVTNTCTQNSAVFLRLSNLTNAHVEVPSNSNYAVPACVGVVGRNVSCGQFANCPAEFACVASIASSEPGANNLTNAHVDANCSSTYATKICCGYANMPSNMTSSVLLPVPAYRNVSLRGYCKASDVDLDQIQYRYTFYRNAGANVSGVSAAYASGVEVNVANISNTSLIVGDSWVLRCTADDGTVNSSYVDSTPVVISALMPEKVVLISPTSGNTTIRLRKPVFQWYATNNTNRYEINLTSSTGCGGNYMQNITATNYTPANDLCVVTEGPNTIYRWAVRACGIDGCAQWSDTWNFSIQPYVSISLVNSSVNFSSMMPGETKNTLSGNPGPFVMQNDGNVHADLVNISADQSLWSTVPLGTSYFQAKARQGSEGISFNASGSQTNWINISSSNQTFVRSLNYNDTNDSMYVDIQITVPGSEPPGTKQAFVVFRWGETP